MTRLSPLRREAGRTRAGPLGRNERGIRAGTAARGDEPMALDICDDCKEPFLGEVCSHCGKPAPARGEIRRLPGEVVLAFAEHAQDRRHSTQVPRSMRSYRCSSSWRSRRARRPSLPRLPSWRWLLATMSRPDSKSTRRSWPVGAVHRDRRPRARATLAAGRVPCRLLDSPGVHVEDSSDRSEPQSQVGRLDAHDPERHPDSG